jgi:hypothetical protein
MGTIARAPPRVDPKVEGKVETSAVSDPGWSIKYKGGGCLVFYKTGETFGVVREKAEKTLGIPEGSIRLMVSGVSVDEKDVASDPKFHNYTCLHAVARPLPLPITPTAPALPSV